MEQPNMVSWLECYDKPKTEDGESMRHPVENRNAFECENCDETFKNKSALKRHKVQHQQELEMINSNQMCVNI